MAQVVKVDFESHKDEVSAEMKQKVYKWLEAIGEDAASTAGNVLTMTNTIDTGRLKNSITCAVDEANQCVYIGTDVEYAIYHEFGTGKYAEGGGGRQTPWAFQDKDGEWHWTHGVPAKHFIQFGATAHQAQYKQMLESALKE
jgi:phage gpG-like protein